MGIGLDVGTSFIIASRHDAKGKVQYSEIRDAFYRISPTTPISAKMIEKGLSGKKFFKDADGSFVIVGQDAIDKAVERHESASRPMFRGVVSPKEKDARKILKFILHEIVGKPTEQGEKLVFCVPAQPVDQADEEFSVAYHEDVLKKDLGEIGFTAVAINEAEAICYSELEQDDFTGICLSFGAGMVNVCLMSSGEPILKFSTTKSGDWIDRMAAVAVNEPDSVVQQEKEQGNFVIGEQGTNPVLNAVSSYYERLIDYTVKQLKAGLSKASNLPKFAEPLPIVVAGGTSRAGGFVAAFEKAVDANGLPVPVKEVRHAKDPLRAVSRGCLIASQL